MVGLGQLIPDKDENEIGLPARRYLQTKRCNFVVLVDDLEYERRDQAQSIFNRYKAALNTVLDEAQRRRSSMHFLANMLEAYYFGDADAVNFALGLNPPMQDHQGDVELIRNPKAQLKRLHPGFNEVEDGGRILEAVRVEHILSNPDACAFLRTLFAWCVRVLESNPYFDSEELSNSCRLNDGRQSEITRGQILELS